MAARKDPRKYLWMPELGLKGFFWQRVLRHVGIIGGAGVGGGSIVWAGVLLEPKDEFFTDPAWPEVAGGWRAQLAEHYRTAARMLGRETTRFVGEMDRHLQATAEAMGAGRPTGPPPWRSGSARKASPCPTRSSAARARTAPGADSAARASSAVPTAARTPWT